MAPPLPSPVQRLSDLLALSRAWQADETRLNDARRSSQRASAVGSLLLSQWDALLEDLQAASGLPLATRQALAAVFDTQVRSSNQTWSMRHALLALQRTGQPPAPTDLAERLQLALIQLGCWPELPAAGQRPRNLTAHGPYANELNKATEHGRADVLRRLLDWEGAGELSQALLHARDTGVGLPVGFMRTQQTGWSWAVRNLSEDALRVWLDAGADPNATDKAGRPVLAYASKPEILRALLAAGADPLALDLPLETRRANLSALWEGWAIPLYWEHSLQTKKGEWAEGEAYLRNSVGAWTEADARYASDRLAYAAYVRRYTQGPVPGLEALAKELGRRSELLASDEVDLGRHRWSFAAAAARRRLLDSDSRGAAGKLPRPPGRRTVIPGVSEALITALADLSPDADAAEKTLRQHGPETVAQALRLLLEELSAEAGSLAGTVLQRRLAQVLGRAPHLGLEWVAAMHGAVDAALATIHHRWPTSTRPSFLFVREEDTSLAMRWLEQHRATVPTEQQARWALMGLIAYREKGAPRSPEHLAACQALLEAAQAGWEPSSLSDEAARDWTSLQRSDPELSAGVEASLAAHRLQADLPHAPARRSRARM